MTCPQSGGPHLRPHHPLSDLILGTEDVVALPPWGTSTSYPTTFTEEPLALSPRGRSHLELYCCPSNPILVSEDPLTWIPR